MNRKTTFQDLKIGEKFIAPGGTAVYTKLTGHSARTTKGRDTLVNSRAEVVPEFTATVADILGSWSKMS